VPEESAGKAPFIFIIAGEPSGDVLGGALMAALKARTGGAVRFAGIGGERMGEEGLRSLVPIEELAIIGLAEVLPRARRIFRRVRETVDAVVRLRPDAVVTIDSSGFTWRVAQRLRARGETLPLIHYVAPMVWAWRAGKARRMARWYDHLLALLPFEPPYFAAVGLPCSYVGHPILESGAEAGDGPGFRLRHDIPADAPLLCLLPGSRGGEVGRMLPVFAATLRHLLPDFPRLHLVVPCVDFLAERVEQVVSAWPARAIVVRGRAEKYAAFAASNLALATSGTVALELALAELPAVIAYRANPVTAWLLRRVVKAPYANLVNLILGREAIPELLLEECTPDRLSSAVAVLLRNGAARAEQIDAYREGLERLGRGGLSPALRAADKVLEIIAARHA